MERLLSIGIGRYFQNRFLSKTPPNPFGGSRPGPNPDRVPLSEMKRYDTQDMFEILRELTEWSQDAAPAETRSIVVPHPDLKGDGWEGHIAEVDGRRVRCRGLRCWVDAAEAVGCRLLMPTAIDDTLARLTFQKLDTSSWHDAPVPDSQEKYGVRSPFFSLDKREEPAYLTAFLRAFGWARAEGRSRILDLGVNSGDEIALFARYVTEDRFPETAIVGVDHCPSAIAEGRRRFPRPNVAFHLSDINRLDELGLGRFDLTISVGTLQSPGVDDKAVLMSLVKSHAMEESAIILGFPNCRYVSGEVVFGAKVRNYKEPELSLLLKDLHFAKRYLQQHRFKVTVFGKHYLFIAAIRSKS